MRFGRSATPASARPHEQLRSVGIRAGALELAGRVARPTAAAAAAQDSAEASATGEGREALLEAAEALESSGESELAAESRVLLALGGYLIGRKTTSRSSWSGRQRSWPMHRSRLRRHLSGARARHAYLAGRYEEACELASEALPMAESVGAADIRAEALLYLGCT